MEGVDHPGQYKVKFVTLYIALAVQVTVKDELIVTFIFRLLLKHLIL